MVIYKRNIQIQKAQADVMRIIQSSSYQSTFETEHSYFSIKYPKRNQRGQIMLVPIKGQVTGSDDVSEVTLELHAGVEIIIGLSILALGLIMMLLRFIFPALGRTTYGVMSPGIGIVISVFYWLRGVEAIDLLEHKMTR